MNTMPNAADQNFEATTDVRTQRVARVYAEALLNAAERQGQAGAVLDEFQSLVADVFRSNPEIESYLASGAVGRNRKAEVLRRTFEGRASAVFLNFLNVLNDHERLDLLRPVFAEYRRLLDQRAGRYVARVKSAVALTDDQRARLRDEIKKVFPGDPILEESVEAELLGGLVVQVGDWLFDASVRSSLASLMNQLIESSSHEIQSRRDRFSSPIGN
jgi:F-type H+-transporting ATPase subunit delta